MSDPFHRNLQSVGGRLKSDDGEWLARFSVLMFELLQLRVPNDDVHFKHNMIRTLVRQMSATYADVIRFVISVDDEQTRRYVYNALFVDDGVPANNSHRSSPPVQQQQHSEFSKAVKHHLERKRTRESSIDEVRNEDEEERELFEAPSRLPKRKKTEAPPSSPAGQQQQQQQKTNQVEEREAESTAPHVGQFNVTVKMLNGRELRVPASVSMSVRHFKENVVHTDTTIDDVHSFTLMYKGVRFGDSANVEQLDSTLEEYGIKGQRAAITLMTKV